MDTQHHSKSQAGAGPAARGPGLRHCLAALVVGLDELGTGAAALFFPISDLNKQPDNTNTRQ